MNTRTQIGALTALLACGPALALAQSSDQQQPVAYEADPGKIDVALDFLADADIVGDDGDEIGDVEAIVRAKDGAEGLSLVFEIDNGWFEQDVEMVAPIGNFTIVDDDTLRLDGVTELTVGNVPRYEAESWVEIDAEAYETVEQAYTDNGWQW